MEDIRTEENEEEEGGAGGQGRESNGMDEEDVANSRNSQLARALHEALGAPSLEELRNELWEEACGVIKRREGS